MQEEPVLAIPLISQLSTFRRERPVLGELWKIFEVMVGGILVAVGLELFLIPNGFLDGGITGISIMIAHHVKIPLGVFLAILNAPFIVFIWRKLGRRVAVKTAIGIVTLAASTIYLHHYEALTDNYTLALGYGGLFLGLGVGLALRAGGALDGTEALASFLSYKTSWSVDQLILGINLAIFVTAAFTLSRDEAMASALLFYVVVAPIIKRVVDGGSELKHAEIYTSEPEAVIRAIHSQNDRRITSHKGKGIMADGTLGEIITLKVLVSRMEESTIGDLVLEADPDAVIIFKEAANVRGGVYEDSGHH